MHTLSLINLTKKISVHKSWESVYTWCTTTSCKQRLINLAPDLYKHSTETFLGSSWRPALHVSTMLILSVWAWHVGTKWMSLSPQCLGFTAITDNQLCVPCEQRACLGSGHLELIVLCFALVRKPHRQYWSFLTVSASHKCTGHMCHNKALC